MPNVAIMRDSKTEKEPFILWVDLLVLESYRVYWFELLST